MDDTDWTLLRGSIPGVVRGNHLELLSFAMRLGSIPACAGEPM